MSDPLCAYCLKPGKLHRDHVVPRSRGGPDNATNIVMACESCNSSKSNRLPSEWLGDRCPAHVREIEEKVNKKIAASFKGRDKKPSRRLYAFNLNSEGQVEYIGEVVSETASHIRIEAVESILFWAGMWSLSGSLYDVPRSDCRLFNDRDVCAQKAEEILSGMRR